MIILGEWKFLRRGSMFWISGVIACVCLSLGAWNGVRRWSQETADAESIQHQVQTLLQTHKARLIFINRAISSGHPEIISKSEFEWGPRQTLWVDAWDPPTTFLPAAPLGFLATGRSDVLPHSYASSAWRGLEPNAPTTDDPLRLLIGDFDLKFVILDVLPLLILLMSFDLVATEREDGTLRLILAQAVSFRSLLLTRAVLRAGSVIALMIAAVACSSIAVYVLGDRFPLLPLSLYVLASVVYLSLWAVLAVVVNTYSRNSTSNSLILGAIWLFAVILIPGAMPVVAQAISPTPSRALYVDAARAARLSIYNGAIDQTTSLEQQSSLIQQFLARHPEWNNRPELSRAGLLGAARGEAHSAYVNSISQRFDQAHARQQKVLSFLDVCSPALLQDEVLTLLSGNSDLRHFDFLNQSLSFFAASKAYFWPRIFRGEIFVPERFQEIPLFRYNPLPLRSVLEACARPALLFGLWTLALGTSFVRRLRTRPDV